MKHYTIHNFKRSEISLATILLALILLLLPACARQPQPARIEEITFQSGEFKLVGELRTPAGTGPFPVILLVHGSGPVDRTFFGYYLPVMERMLRAGYAVFSWDKPGTGESTGQLSDSRVIHQRAQIVLDAIEVMKERRDIDAGHIGLWGISQGGWVMPLVLLQTKDIAFMICVSCAGVSGDDQLAFQRISQSICDGVPAAKDAGLRSLLAELDMARKIETYDEYLHYREVLDALAGLGSPAPHLAGLGAVPEQAWLLNDPEYQGWWNPARVIEQTKIPILVINGDKDTNLDPVQGAYAWKAAMEKAGNSDSRVELLPGLNHYMTAANSTCLKDHMKTFEQVLKDQGYGPEDDPLALLSKEPGKQTPLSAFPFAAEYLDLIEEWLRGLRP